MKIALCMLAALPVVILSALVATAEPTKRPSKEDMAKIFPLGANEVLEKSDQFTLYALDPEKQTKEPGAFHYWRIVGEKAITDPKVKAELIDALYDGVADQNITAARCFEPHHGIHVTRKGKTVDLVICFACRGIAVYVDGVSASAKISDKPRQVFDRALK